MDYMPSATAGAVPHLLNILASLSDTIVKRIAGEQEDISEWESGKKETFFEVINKPIIHKFFKDFNTNRKATDRLIRLWLVESSVIFQHPLP